VQQLEFALPRIVDQGILHSEEPGARPGDCLRACFASIFDRSLLEVPHFAEADDADDDWWELARGFVTRVTLGEYELKWFPPRPQIGGPGGISPDHAVVLTGPSPRGPFNHAVVGDPRTMEMLHDPHPSRAGILSLDVVYAVVKTG
jgi:hypothetical protein